MEIIEHGKTYLVYTCPRCLCMFVACEIDSYKDVRSDKQCQNTEL